jgi:hypothetical protein
MKTAFAGYLFSILWSWSKAQVPTVSGAIVENSATVNGGSNHISANYGWPIVSWRMPRPASIYDQKYRWGFMTWPTGANPTDYILAMMSKTGMAEARAGTAQTETGAAFVGGSTDYGMFYLLYDSTSIRVYSVSAASAGSVSITFAKNEVAPKKFGKYSFRDEGDAEYTYYISTDTSGANTVAFVKIYAALASQASTVVEDTFANTAVEFRYGMYLDTNYVAWLHNVGWLAIRLRSTLNTFKVLTGSRQYSDMATMHTTVRYLHMPFSSGDICAMDIYAAGSTYVEYSCTLSSLSSPKFVVEFDTMEFMYWSSDSQAKILITRAGTVTQDQFYFTSYSYFDNFHPPNHGYCEQNPSGAGQRCYVVKPALISGNTQLFIHSVSYLITLCSVPNCQTCAVGSITVCATCLPTYGKRQPAGTCDLISALVGEGVDGTNVITPCSDTSCTLCASNYLMCTSCGLKSSVQTYQYNGLCYLIPDLPTGVGADLSNSLHNAKLCSMTNCDLCKENRLTCTSCLATPNQYFLYNNLCYYPVTTLPTNIGANLDTFIGQTCDTVGCDDCKSNYLTCAKCNTSPDVLYLLNNICYKTIDLPDNYGPDISSNPKLGVACTDFNCKNCRTDHQTCLSCFSPVTPQYYLYQAACKLPIELPDLVGADTTINETQACLISNCQKCQNDYRTCSACTYPTTPQYYVYNNDCVLASGLPDGMGANLLTYQSQGCKDPKCKDCKTDYTICVACYPSTTPQYFLYQDGCKLASELPNYIGANNVDFTTAGCTVLNCMKCQNDYQTCEACERPTSPQYYLFQNQCIFASLLPDMIGANLGTFGTQACFDANCQDCRINFMICKGCLNPATPQYYLSEDICKLPADLPFGFGANLLTYIAQQCYEGAKCLLCKEDYTKCTQCDDMNGYYLDLGTGLCLLVQEIPDGYGANLLTKEVSPCVDPGNCLKCQADYTLCTACEPLNDMFLDPYGNTCVLRANIPDGYGADTQSQQVASCFEGSTCLLCQHDYKVCTQCDSFQDQFLDTATAVCVMRTAIPPGFGADTTNQIVAQCTNFPNCLLCQQDFTQCTSCDHTTSYYLDVASGTCVHVDLIPTGSGANLITYNIDPCDQGAKCVECKSDHLLCELCNDSQGFYLNKTSKVCENETSFPVGWGPNVNTLYIEKCTWIGCLKCPTNIDICQTCDKLTNYFLNMTTFACMYVFDIAEGYGANRYNGQVTNCKVPDCLGCQYDYNICKACKTDLRQCFDSEVGSCVDFDRIPANAGCNLITGTITSCRDLGCYNCSDSHLICKECDLTMGFYLEDGICKNIRALPSGTGLNIVTRKPEPCISTGCLECNADNAVCLVCDESKNFFLKKSACEAKVATKVVDKLKRVYMTVNPATVNFEFTSTKALKNKTLQATIADQTGKQWTGSDLLPITMDDTTLIINIQIEENINRATIIVEEVINHNSTDSTATTDSSGIVLPLSYKGITILNSKGAQAAASTVNGLMDTTSGMRSASSIALAIANPAMGNLLDMMFCDFMYMGMTGAQNLTYPSLIFQMVADSKIFPFDVPNIFENFAFDPTCNPPVQIAFMGNDCSFLLNYGEDIGMLGINLGCNVMFMLFGFGLARFVQNRPMLQQSKIVSIASHICMVFGMRYFLLKMDGNILEIVMFAVNSIRTVRYGEDRTVGTLGAVASFIFMIFYIFYGWLLWKTCRNMIRAYNTAQYITNNPEAKELQEAFDLQALSPRFMEFVFDGYKYPINPKLLWTPMIIFLRNFLMGLFIVLFIELPDWQLPLVLLVEGSFYIFLLRAKFRGSKIEYFAETSIAFMRVLFVLVGMLSFTKLADDDPNGPVGIMAGIILLANAAIALFAILSVLFITAYELICKLPCFNRGEKEEMVRTKIYTKNMKDIAIAVSMLKISSGQERIEVSSIENDVDNEKQIEDEEKKEFGSDRAQRFNFKEALIVENLELLQGSNSEESRSLPNSFTPAVTTIPLKPISTEEEANTPENNPANVDENATCKNTEYNIEKYSIKKSQLELNYRDSYYEESKVTPRFHGLPSIDKSK